MCYITGPPWGCESGSAWGRNTKLTLCHSRTAERQVTLRLMMENLRLVRGLIYTLLPFPATIRTVLTLRRGNVWDLNDGARVSFNENLCLSRSNNCDLMEAQPWHCSIGFTTLYGVGRTTVHNWAGAGQVGFVYGAKRAFARFPP